MSERQVEMAENNERAVVISEEVEFLEHLMTANLPSDVMGDVIERRDLLRDSIQGMNYANPTDEPVSGMTPPVEVEGGVRQESEAYDADDDMPVLPEDEDHEYKANRAPMDSDKQVCLVCGEPFSEHGEEN